MRLRSLSRQHGLGVQEAIAGSTGRDKAWGVTEFSAKEGPITITRLTQDTEGRFKAVVVPATFEDNKAKSFGAYGWARIDNMTPLYRDVLCRHFPHHTAFCMADVSDAIWEAFGYYLDIDMYTSGQNVPDLWTPMPPIPLETKPPIELAFGPGFLSRAKSERDSWVFF